MDIEHQEYAGIKALLADPVHRMIDEMFVEVGGSCKVIGKRQGERGPRGGGGGGVKLRQAPGR